MNSILQYSTRTRPRNKFRSLLVQCWYLKWRSITRSSKVTGSQYNKSEPTKLNTFLGFRWEHQTVLWVYSNPCKCDRGSLVKTPTVTRVALRTQRKSQGISCSTWLNMLIKVIGHVGNELGACLCKFTVGMGKYNEYLISIAWHINSAKLVSPKCIHLSSKELGNK
jgi:hypothetical protein